MSDLNKLNALYESTKLSMFIAYLLWFLLGGFGAHYFYIKRSDLGTIGLVLLLSSFFGSVFVLIYCIYVLAGIFTIYPIVREYNIDLKENLTSIEGKGDE